MALPPFVSLAFLPDPAESQQLSHEAHLGGHEILIHLPMEPEGGDAGGRIVAQGTPEQVAANGASHTGEALRAVLAQARARESDA